MTSSGHTSLPQNQVGAGGRAGGFLPIPTRRVGRFKTPGAWTCILGRKRVAYVSFPFRRHSVFQQILNYNRGTSFL
jgi:hypothetical protein